MCEACRAAKLWLIGACVAVGEGERGTTGTAVLFQGDALPPFYSREMFGASWSAFAVREEETKNKEIVAGEGGGVRVEGDGQNGFVWQTN